jgi:hypothetical protein
MNQFDDLYNKSYLAHQRPLRIRAYTGALIGCGIASVLILIGVLLIVVGR